MAGYKLAAGPRGPRSNPGEFSKLYDVEVDVVHHGDLRLVVPHRPVDADRPA